ncbi:MAG: [Fe-Fe] hydrogenase large subunit C-terminal domain-containing protein [Planctomycetota bacterium]
MTLKHGFRINHSLCTGKMECMRACPTRALRVRNGKAVLVPERCIDCGECLRTCPAGAISATTLSFQDLEKYKFKVAIPSAVLFSQFPMRNTPRQVAQALLNIGFDAVWDVSVEVEIVNRAIRRLVENWGGPIPLISSSCPVVVRLVQVSYPTMVGQILPIEVPRELAGRAVKERYSKELGISPDEVAAVYVTPCQAKTISILQPAERERSYLDGAIGISEIYNDLLFEMQKSSEGEQSDSADGRIHLSSAPSMLRWGIPDGQAANLSRHRYIAITGLPNLISVLDDIERGKIRNVDYIECYACFGGCIGGNLTVENLYVARAKLMHLFATAPPPTEAFLREVEERWETEDFSLRAPVQPRQLPGEPTTLLERVKRMKAAEESHKMLPGVNCGLCGAPGCHALAQDIAAGYAKLSDCVFHSHDRIDKLRAIYLGKPSSTDT